MRGPGLSRTDADRLLDGSADLPDRPDLAPLAELVQAARRPLVAGDPRQQAATVAAMVAAAWSPPPAAPHPRRGSRRLRLAAGAAAGAVGLFGGLTAASACSTTVAAAVHRHLGITLPLAATTGPASPARPEPGSTPAVAGTDRSNSDSTAPADADAPAPGDHDGRGELRSPARPDPSGDSGAFADHDRSDGRAGPAGANPRPGSPRVDDERGPGPSGTSPERAGGASRSDQQGQRQGSDTAGAGYRP
ncbi:MAG TPA: hypothetical protein VE990_10680 [Acidimicrobiales bacterium]|nr:hypothetical protein [Acidimicrobiales bacterium]